MFVFQAEKLKEIGTEIFTAQGMTRERAEFIADTLVEANLTGHDSHGVFYFVRYSDRIRERFIDPKAEPTIAKETASTALIDGRWAPGQITALKVTETAVEKAKRQRISAVGAFRCNHIGRVGYYTNLAASRGVAALMFVNVGHPAVTVFNGTGSVFGTNPFSAAVPTGKSKSFLLDYATSVVAEGKISVARSKGEKIPTHWTRDKEGRVTDDPWAIREGGWLLPFGEHKGYCLQLLMELLGAVMTGSRTGFEPDTDPPSTNGVFAIAFNLGSAGSSAILPLCEENQVVLMPHGANKQFYDPGNKWVFVPHTVQFSMACRAVEYVLEKKPGARIGMIYQDDGFGREGLEGARAAAKFVKSNAIVFAKDQMTIGIGAGQMSRVYSTRIAAIKAVDHGLSVKGSVMASDAFFPFRDGIDSAAEHGITAVIQPGGSMRDEEVIAAADAHELAMVFTGMRHFRH